MQTSPIGATPDAVARVPWSVRRTTSGLRFLLINPTIVEKREHMHIGLATVGSYVKQRSNHQVRILDFMAFRNTWKDRLRHILDEFQPDVIGMYISSPYFAAARTVAAEVKRLVPQVPILGMGGIRTGLDALQFVLAGASAVSVGTAVFNDPSACARVHAELAAALAERGFATLTEAVGYAHR